MVNWRPRDLWDQDQQLHETETEIKISVSRSRMSRDLNISAQHWFCAELSAFSERERSRSLSICSRPSVCRPSSVCLSVTLEHPPQAAVVFGNISTAVRPLVPGHLLTSTKNFTEIVPGETPPSGKLNTTGVAKYSHCWPNEGYISETVQDMR